MNKYQTHSIVYKEFFTVFYEIFRSVKNTSKYIHFKVDTLKGLKHQ